MNVDPSVLSWKDWLMVGVGVGLWLGNRGRRHMGERLGSVEKIVAVLARLSGVDADSGRHEKPSDPGRPRK